MLFCSENNVKALVLKSPVSDYKAIEEGEISVYESAKSLNIPVLIIHGSFDADVPCGQSVDLSQILQFEHELLLIDGADHRYSNQNHFALMIDNIVEWLLQKL